MDLEDQQNLPASPETAAIVVQEVYLDDIKDK